MKEKLAPRDYLDFYPLCTPEEIKKEFGNRSLSPRQIRRYYELLELKPQGEELDRLIESSCAIVDLRIGEGDWAALVSENLVQMKKQKINDAWKRIRKVEEARNS